MRRGGYAGGVCGEDEIMGGCARKCGGIFVSLQKDITIIIMKRDKKIVLRSIRNILQQIAPAGTKAILFGSQARGDAHEGSDWDILIILDKATLEADDYDNISYPLRELGWQLKECINPVMYTLKDWMKYSFSPFYHNVNNEGIVLL